MKNVKVKIKLVATPQIVQLSKQFKSNTQSLEKYHAHIFCHVRKSKQFLKIEKLLRTAENMLCLFSEQIFLLFSS
jgi:hypothetical protein